MPPTSIDAASNVRPVGTSAHTAKGSRPGNIGSRGRLAAIIAIGTAASRAPSATGSFRSRIDVVTSDTGDDARGFYVGPASERVTHNLFVSHGPPRPPGIPDGTRSGSYRLPAGVVTAGPRSKSP